MSNVALALLWHLSGILQQLLSMRRCEAITCRGICKVINLEHEHQSVHATLISSAFCRMQIRIQSMFDLRSHVVCPQLLPS